MPNSSGIFRALDWSMIQDALPSEISTNLPDGDPLENKGDIQESIEQLQSFGPKGKKVIDRYIEGEMSDQEMFYELDKVVDEIDSQEFNKYNRNLDKLIEAINSPKWKAYCPFVSPTIDKEKFMK